MCLSWLVCSIIFGNVSWVVRVIVVVVLVMYIVVSC